MMNSRISNVFFQCTLKPAVERSITFPRRLILRLSHRLLIPIAVLCTATSAYADMDEILESLSLEDLLNLENIVITPQEKVESRQDTQITFNVYNTDLLELIIANSDVDIRGYSPRTYVLRTSGKKLNIGVLIRSLDTGEPLLAMDPYLECQKQKNLPTYVGRFF